VRRTSDRVKRIGAVQRSGANGRHDARCTSRLEVAAGNAGFEDHYGPVGTTIRETGIPSGAAAGRVIPPNNRPRATNMLITIRAGAAGYRHKLVLGHMGVNQKFRGGCAP